MKILITNDDGVEAPGLLALFRAMVDFGDVTVVAPSECHSSRGHAVCVREEMRVEEREHSEMGRVYAVHASPADSVRIGLQVILGDLPDLVVAGINPGANMGVDVYYSGTVAAAREAAMLGTRAMAVSTYISPLVELSWEDKSAQTRQAVSELSAVPTGPGQFWNVNFPATPPGEQPGPLVFARQSTEPQGVSFERAGSDADGVVAYRFAGDYAKRPATPPHDVSRVFDGHVTASLLQLDTSIDVDALADHRSPRHRDDATSQ